EYQESRMVLLGRARGGNHGRGPQHPLRHPAAGRQRSGGPTRRISGGRPLSPPSFRADPGRGKTLRVRATVLFQPGISRRRDPRRAGPSNPDWFVDRRAAGSPARGLSEDSQEISQPENLPAGRLPGGIGKLAPERGTRSGGDPDREELGLRNSIRKLALSAAGPVGRTEQFGDDGGGSLATRQN